MLPDLPFAPWRLALILGAVLCLLLVRSATSVSSSTSSSWGRRLAAGSLKVGVFSLALALLSSIFLLDDPDAEDWGTLLVFYLGLGLGSYVGLALSERLNAVRGFPFFLGQMIEFAGLAMGCTLGWVLADLINFVAFDSAMIWGQGDLFSSFFLDIGLWMVTSLVVLTGSVRLIYNVRLYAARQQQQAQELRLLRLQDQATRAQLQSIQARVNPHFLYNALSSLAGLIHERPAEAEQMTLGLARLFRSALDADGAPTTTVRREVELVETYLAIEAARFGDRLRTRIEVDPAVADRRVPRFLVQPLVENAVKHGVAQRFEGGEVIVRVQPEGEDLAVTVEDDGPPFPADLLGGYGLQSVQQSLALLYPDRHTLTFQNAGGDHAKRVRIVLRGDRSDALAEVS